MLNYVQLFATPRAIAHQVRLSMGFSRQEYWSGLPFPSLGDIPNSGIKFVSLASPASAGKFFTTEPPGKPVDLSVAYFCFTVYPSSSTRRFSGDIYLKDVRKGHMGVEVHRQKPKARTFLGLPQASLTHWPPLLSGGPWLHSFQSSSGRVLHPKGLLVQKPVGQMRYGGRSLDR